MADRGSEEDDYFFFFIGVVRFFFRGYRRFFFFLVSVSNFLVIVWRVEKCRIRIGSGEGKRRDVVVVL